jgi:hypothetical protein
LKKNIKSFSQVIGNFLVYACEDDHISIREAGRILEVPPATMLASLKREKGVKSNLDALNPVKSQEQT